MVSGQVPTVPVSRFSACLIIHPVRMGGSCAAFPALHLCNLTAEHPPLIWLACGFGRGFVSLHACHCRQPGLAWLRFLQRNQTGFVRILQQSLVANPFCDLRLQSVVVYPVGESLQVQVHHRAVAFGDILLLHSLQPDAPDRPGTRPGAVFGKRPAAARHRTCINARWSSTVGVPAFAFPSGFGISTGFTGCGL